MRCARVIKSDHFSARTSEFEMAGDCAGPVNIRVMSVYAGPSGSTCQDIGVRGALELTFIDIDIYPTHLQLVQVIVVEALSRDDFWVSLED